MLRNASFRQTDGVIHEQPLTIYERESSAASNDTYLVSEACWRCSVSAQVSVA